MNIRTTAPLYPDPPYDWTAQSKGQCTWYAYWRVQEMGFTPPCWWDRETQKGCYTNAKLWYENYRDPWVQMPADYQPVWGDIAVFDGNYGHVIVIEQNDGGNCLISEYNHLIKEGFDNYEWVAGSSFPGCGRLKGYLHNPNRDIEDLPVDEGQDIIRQFELFVNNIEGQIRTLTETNSQLRNRLEQINDLSKMEVK